MLALTGRSDGGAALLERFREAGFLPPVDQVLYANLVTYLPDDLHVKVDRMSMAHGLEARSPLLDTAVIELLAPVRARDKVGFRAPKPILRETFRDLLPDGVWRQRKHGFGVPIDRWFDAGLGEVYRDEVLAGDGLLREWINIEHLSRFLSAHAAGDRHGPRLWTLLTLERWLRMLSGPEPLERPAPQSWDADVR